MRGIGFAAWVLGTSAVLAGSPPLAVTPQAQPLSAVIRPPVVGATPGTGSPSDPASHVAASATGVTTESLFRGAQGRMLAGGVAYVSVKAFEPYARSQLARLLYRFDLVEDPRGIVLDLRDCLSGDIDVAADAAQELVRGPIAQVGEVLYAGVERRHFRRPIAVLVNRGTSGVAEMVAAAVRTQPGCMLVGETTAGVTAYYENPLFVSRGKAPKVMGHWLLPSRASIEGTGLKPDHPVDESRDDAARLALAASVQASDDPLSTMGVARPMELPVGDRALETARLQLAAGRVAVERDCILSSTPNPELLGETARNAWRGGSPAEALDLILQLCGAGDFFLDSRPGLLQAMLEFVDAHVKPDEARIFSLLRAAGRESTRAGDMLAAAKICDRLEALVGRPGGPSRLEIARALDAIGSSQSLERLFVSGFADGLRARAIAVLSAERAQGNPDVLEQLGLLHQSAGHKLLSIELYRDAIARLTGRPVDLRRCTAQLAGSLRVRGDSALAVAAGAGMGLPWDADVRAESAKAAALVPGLAAEMRKRGAGLRSGPDGVAARVELARCALTLGCALRSAGRYDDAEKVYERALEALGTDAATRAARSRVMASRGRALEITGQIERAAASYRAAIDAAQGDASAAGDCAAYKRALADVLRVRGQDAEAEVLESEATAIPGPVGEFEPETQLTPLDLEGI